MGYFSTANGYFNVIYFRNHFFPVRLSSPLWLRVSWVWIFSDWLGALATDTHMCGFTFLQNLLSWTFLSYSLPHTFYVSHICFGHSYCVLRWTTRVGTWNRNWEMSKPIYDVDVHVKLFLPFANRYAVVYGFEYRLIARVLQNVYYVALLVIVIQHSTDMCFWGKNGLVEREKLGQKNTATERKKTFLWKGQSMRVGWWRKLCVGDGQDGKCFDQFETRKIRLRWTREWRTYIFLGELHIS